jgi:hypothetical protein
MPNNTHFIDAKKNSASKAYEVLATKAKSLGQIMQKYPEVQSNSPELYLLAYIKELGLAKN